MLTLLVPGVGMGGSDAGGGAAPTGRFLPLMGVGRMFIPFLFMWSCVYEVVHGR